MPKQRTRLRKLWRTCWFVAASLVLVALATQRAAADEPATPDSEDAEQADAGGPLNMLFPTLGGKQFWADRLVYFDWRIQKNVMTGHCRLLDGENHRHAWGTFEHCQAKLAAIREERNLPPMRGKAVIVLHGLFRTRNSMVKMADYLHKEGGYLVLSVSYPTTRGTLGQHAEHLHSVLTNLGEVEEVSFVAHSLGNLVIRHYLADYPEDAGRPPLGRIVMLAPPNQGAELAERLVPIDFTKQITGPAAWQLAKNWSELAPHLATPTCEFGILAGGNGKESGRNPLLQGDDDLVVSVASTRLDGARDFRVLPVWHTTMMNNALVQQQTLEFLRHGYFESEETRQPLEAAAAAGPQ